jgi:hypothetical protein
LKNPSSPLTRSAFSAWAVLCLSSCALLQSSPDSDYGDGENPSDRGLPELYHPELRRERLEAERLEQEDAIRYGLSRRDLVVGMRPRDVQDLWGEPGEVQTAGERGQGYERWVYFEGLSSRWSLSTARFVYFENGRVVGWETASRR